MEKQRKRLESEEDEVDVPDEFSDDGFGDGK